MLPKKRTEIKLRRSCTHRRTRDSQAPQSALSDNLQHWLVDDAEHRDDLLDAVARTPFGEGGDEVERALGVEDAGGRVEKADWTEATRVVPAAARIRSWSIGRKKGEETMSRLTSASPARNAGRG